MNQTLEKDAARTTARTQIGWQGLRCELPPEWSLTGLAMSRESGTLRIDAPAPSALSVQIRWLNADARPGSPTLAGLLAPHLRRLSKRPEPLLPTPDLKGNLQRLFRETEKSATKAKKPFDSSMKGEREEGENGDRTALPFSWTGEGRGQGKIWFCKTCRRIVVAQMVGLSKDGSAIGQAASQLFATLRCHSTDGFDRWALYDFGADVPEDFRLESQQLLSGYLNLTFARGAERLVIERWGLANMTLQRFTLEDWFRSRALLPLRGRTKKETEVGRGHTALLWSGKLGLTGSVKALQAAKLNLRHFPRFYTGGAWHCEAENRIVAIQAFSREPGLWQEVAELCTCH